MKKIITILILCFICTIIQAQVNIKYNYKGKFELILPNTLEVEFDNNVQPSYIVQIAPKCKKITTTDISDRVVWQQAGLNNPTSKEVFNKYCRVITIYSTTEPDEVPRRYEKFSVDQNFWDEEYNGIKEENAKLNLTVLKCLGLNVVQINGYPGYYISYLRTGWQGAPPVVVYRYVIFNGSELCQISFSYRQSEAQQWAYIKNIIEKTFIFK